MRCGQCGKDIKAGILQCPYCQAPVHYGGNSQFYNQAAQNKVNITDFFSSIFSSQPAGAGDRMFVSGTALTTPTPDRMLQEWNKPWLYARFLLFGLLFCFLCYFLFTFEEHPGGLYMLLSLGSLVVPLSVLIFYWEINIPRDIPFYRVMMIFFIGGILSIIFSLFIWIINGPHWTAPLFEEPGKVLALAIFIYRFDIRYIFGGMLIGAAVGAGFAAFEDIFYALGRGMNVTLYVIMDALARSPQDFVALLEYFPLYLKEEDIPKEVWDNVLKPFLKLFKDTLYTVGSDIFTTRGVFTIGGHVTWAAIEGGALAMVKGNDSFKLNHFFAPKFLVCLATVMFLHFAWNGGLYKGYGLFSLITMTEENSEFVSCVLHGSLCLVAMLLAFTLIRQAIFQVLEVVNTASIQPPEAYANVPMLLATNGPLANALFPLERRITFGRDPALCNVVFPSGTPGVSRRHCVLEPHSDGMYLMDLGSSSGTFLQNDQRLQPNQWVKVSDNFCLGSPNVMFAIQRENGQAGKAQPQLQQNFPPPQPNQQISPPIQPSLINPPQPFTANITIFGVAGPMQGRTFSDPQRLIIGREPTQCNVVLPPQTPGVSRKHCILERRQGEVYIMDVGSSAGTFFQNGNGQRLPLNQWIKVTDNFYLGSPNVMFSVN